MIIEWPANLVPTNVTVRAPRKTAGLNTSLTEFTQAVPVIRPPFGLALEFGELFGSDVLAYRALLGALEGRANLVRVPLFDLWFAAKDAQIGAGAVPHSDGTGFSDGTLYLTSDLEGVTVSAAQGARTITADFSGYGAGAHPELIQGGLYFGLGDHPYLATQVFWEGSVATIRCTPSLRTDYAAEALRLRPVMVARLTSDDGGELVLRRGRYGAPALDMTEAFVEPLS